MADHRKPAKRIVYEDASGRRVAELFPAEQFARKAPGNHAGRYRVRVDRAWLTPGGQKYAFLTELEAFAALAGIDPAPAAPPRPDLPPGTRVRVPSGSLAGETLYTVTHTKSGVFQGADGRWRVLAILFDDPILVDTILPMRVVRK